MQYNKYKTYLLILLLSLAVNIDAADKTYFEDSKRGWFWGEKIIKQKDKEKPKENIEKKISKQNIVIHNGKEYKTVEKTTNIPWDILDTLHPDEISNLETETKSISVMYPTTYNVTEYKKFQKYILDKATSFTDTSYFVTKQDPDISNWVSDKSMSSRMQISAKRNDLWDKQKKVIEKYKNDIIILVATLPTCSFCKEQIPLLKAFEEEFNVEYKEVDISTNSKFAINYQVQKTPDLFLLFRDEGNKPLLTRFGNGLHTIQDLKAGVLASLYTFKKIPKDYLEY